jgi:hypothetical protein
MPATQTQTEPKTKKSTKKSANTKVEPDAQTEVRPSLALAIHNYAKADHHVQSTLWPLVDEALDMFDEPVLVALAAKDINEARKRVAGDFRIAFAKDRGITTGQLDKNPEYHRFLMVSLNVTTVAALGRDIVHPKDKKIGFWTLLQYAHDLENHPDAKSSVKEPKGTAKKSKSNSEPETEADDNEPEAKSGSAQVPKPMHRWCEGLRQLVQHEKVAFINELKFCITQTWLPDGNWIKILEDSLLNEKE